MSSRGKTAVIISGFRPSAGPGVSVYVESILKSEKPDLIMNLKTARALRLSVPQSLLATADEVIE